MKKRNILTIALALVLTAVLSVGATLAYLTSTDTQVVNTFKFANNMVVKIQEPTPDSVAIVEQEKITAKDPSKPQKGYIYENIVPSQKLNKAPEILTTTSVDAFVFVKISGASEYVEPADILVYDPAKDITPADAPAWTAEDGWLVIGTVDEYGNGVYCKPVKGDSNEQSLGTIFTQVQVGNTTLQGTTTATPDDIILDVYEIQQTGFFATAETTLVEAAQAAYGQVTFDGQ